jgi:5'-deoxynucleotidase YfbR-like HD superfamily hydrolase
VTAITRFLYEIGLLKRYPRTGWLQLGVRTPESVADHSFRASVAAAVIASLEGADPQRAAFLALWHDSQETRTTDLPHLAQRYRDVQPWIESALSRLQTPAARQLATEALDQAPLDWLDQARPEAGSGPS